MTKVDWSKLELEYTTKTRLSYDIIAKRYGLAKSTVVRRAKKEDWKGKRERFQKELINRARKSSLESAEETNNRHLQRTYMIQDMVRVETSKFIKKMADGDTMSSKDTRSMLKLFDAYFKAVMMERRIKGLNTKPVQVRLNDRDDIDYYLEALGLIEPPADHTYKEVKGVIDDLDELIAYRRKMQSYIDQVDERGKY